MSRGSSSRTIPEALGTHRQGLSSERAALARPPEGGPRSADGRASRLCTRVEWATSSRPGTRIPLRGGQVRGPSYPRDRATHLGVLSARSTG